MFWQPLRGIMANGSSSPQCLDQHNSFFAAFETPERRCWQTRSLWAFGVHYRRDTISRIKLAESDDCLCTWSSQRVRNVVAPIRLRLTGASRRSPSVSLQALSDGLKPFRCPQRIFATKYVVGLSKASSKVNEPAPTSPDCATAHMPLPQIYSIQHAYSACDEELLVNAHCQTMACKV